MATVLTEDRSEISIRFDQTEIIFLLVDNKIPFICNASHSSITQYPNISEFTIVPRRFQRILTKFEPILGTNGFGFTDINGNIYFRNIYSLIQHLKNEV